MELNECFAFTYFTVNRCVEFIQSTESIDRHLDFSV